jgi:hypothetical protein
MAWYASKIKIPTYVILVPDFICRDRGFQVSGKDMYQQGSTLTNRADDACTTAITYQAWIQVFLFVATVLL